jgi:hypothetical protein
MTSKHSATKLASMPDRDESESESESEKEMDIDEVTLTKVLPRDTKSTLQQCVLALAMVLDVGKSALWRDLSSPFRPENKFAGPGDVACCLSALDHLLKIARVSAVQFFQPPRSHNALSVGERSYSMPAKTITARKCYAWQ